MATGQYSKLMFSIHTSVSDAESENCIRYLTNLNLVRAPSPSHASVLIVDPVDWNQLFLSLLDPVDIRHVIDFAWLKHCDDLKQQVDFGRFDLTRSIKVRGPNLNAKEFGFVSIDAAQQGDVVYMQVTQDDAHGDIRSTHSEDDDGQDGGDTDEFIVAPGYSWTAGCNLIYDVPLPPTGGAQRVGRHKIQINRTGAAFIQRWLIWFYVHFDLPTDQQMAEEFTPVFNKGFAVTPPVSSISMAEFLMEYRRSLDPEWQDILEGFRKVRLGFFITTSALSQLRIYSGGV